MKNYVLALLSVILVLAPSASRRALDRDVRRDVEVSAGSSGLELRAKHLSLGLDLVRFGREGSATAVRRSEPRVEGGAIRYDRGAGLVEWYLDRPEGIEQAFTVDQRPTGEGPLVLSYETTGALRPELVGPRDAVFRDEGGVDRVEYGGLRAVDADGRELDAAIVTEKSGSIALRVDDEGARYPLFVDPLIVVKEAKFVASDTAASGYFGQSVAVDADTAVVGSLSGKAYVLTRSGGMWTEETKLTPDVTADGFANAVSVRGDTALVGARDFSGSTPGAAFVFVRAAGTWTQQTKLTSDDGSAGDVFGGAVSIDGDTALVGALGRDDAGSSSGAAYVFVRSGTAWSQQAKLTAAGAAAGDAFGSSVSLSGDTAIVGAPGQGGGIGAAYVFVRSGTTWAPQKALMPASGKRFGISVSVSGDTAVVGEPTDIGVGVGQASPAGSAFVFVRTGTNWAQQGGALGGAVAGAYFGVSVAVDGDLAIVGARGDTAGKGALDIGAVYAFRRSGSTWISDGTIVAGDGAPGDELGAAVAIRGGTAVIGAARADTPGLHSGAAYAFTLTVANGSTCLTAGECPTGFCVDGVCCDTACGGGVAGDCLACSKAAGAVENGTCAPAIAGTVCRASAASCDAEEVCDGTGASCPTDGKAADGTACSEGVCTAGHCDASASSGGASGGPGSGPGGGPGANGDAPGGASDDGGCRAAATDRAGSFWLLAIAAAIVLARRRFPSR